MPKLALWFPSLSMKNIDLVERESSVLSHPFVRKKTKGWGTVDLWLRNLKAQFARGHRCAFHTRPNLVESRVARR
jgi:hypothetical protein